MTKTAPRQTFRIHRKTLEVLHQYAEHWHGVYCKDEMTANAKKLRAAIRRVEKMLEEREPVK